MDDATAEQLTSRQRAVWSAGDWPEFAPRIQEVADRTVESIGVGEGDDYLDVATGSGNAAEAAARRGAKVSGLDLVPELVAVARPGSVIGVAAWTPTGAVGEMFKRLAQHLPPPPEDFVPAAMWGDEDHVRGLFAGLDVELGFEKRMATLEFESSQQWMDYTEANLGPVVLAKALLEPQGRWEAAQADLIALQEETNEADDGSLRTRGEYLLTTIRPG
jgi:hypothetical protein